MEYKMKPAYKGYKAYEYLEEERISPNLSGATGTGPGRHVVELEPEQEARVELLAKYPYVSVHDHPTLFPKDVTSKQNIDNVMRNGGR